MLSRTLAAEGYAVEASPDGGDALASVERSTPDLVVLDLSMPGLDGLSVARRLRDKGLGLPILMLTARDAVPDRVAGLDSGADDYLVKPFAAEELIARVRALLRRGRCSQLGDLDGPRVERAIEGTVEMARDEQIDAGSHDDDSEQDRERRRHHRPQPERQPTHRIRKPEPRTVSISGGSPSFARRYETYWSTTFRLAAAGLPQTRSSASSRVTI